MISKKYTLPLALVFITNTFTYSIEPLKAGINLVAEAKVKKSFDTLDKNTDGLFKRKEDIKQWKKIHRFDSNKDASIDFDEYKKGKIKYIDSPGKKLLNVAFKKIDNEPVLLDFYFPDVDESQDKSVVIYTHGGGWAAGSKNGAAHFSFGKVHKALLKKGFCVVSVGYRLVTKDSKISMRDCVIDSKDALRFISAYKEELGIDPMKIYTFGDSAGGHLAQMLLLSPSDTLVGDSELANYSYKTVAGVSWYGPCDFQDIQLFNHKDSPTFRDRFGPRIMGKNTKPENKIELYKEMSPVSYLNENSPPLLMIQGDKDTTIPVKQAYRMQEALETINAPVEIMIIKNAGHNWRSVGAPITPNTDAIINKTVDFLSEQ